MNKLLLMVGIATLISATIAKGSDPPGQGGDKQVRDPTAEMNRIRDQIALDMQSAENQLKTPNVGPETQHLQERALRNIDRLIELLRNPPPSNNQDSSPMSQKNSQPQGGQQAGQQSQPTSSGQRSRRERRQQQTRSGQSNQQTNPHAAGQAPTPVAGQAPRSGVAQPTRPNAQVEAIADMSKDIWGHLPETLRQEMDQYYRDRFMPRYRDLLKEYYNRLAEQDRGSRRDR